MRIRKIALGAVALAFPLGILAVAAAPSIASATTLKTGTGTYGCSTLTGTIKFNPPLSSSGTATSDAVTATVDASGCKGTGEKPKVTTSTSVGHATIDSNNCSALESGGLPPVTFTITYPNAAPSTYVATTSDTVGSPI
ncbi:MAG: hypothetical protein WAM97_22930, partial [Acidimicrobiales bacterium]